MCGIVGVVGRQPPEWIERMNAVHAYRGPDDSGVFRDPVAPLSFAMRRLSILDVAGGHQPMANDDESAWIVYNGELFNAPELRRELQAEGRRFRTDHSDTEVLLRLYEARGERMLEGLNGMFAFAVYDRRRQIVFGARDRFGIKPLYLAHDASSGRLAFASEAKSLLELPFVERAIDPQSLHHYLSLQYVPAPATIFAGIAKVPAAHSFTWSIPDRALRLNRYWSPRFTPDAAVPAEEWPGRIRAALAAAVERWSLSDVPVACSLSGGIDSSAIVGLMAEGGAPGLRTYTLGFEADGEGLDERELARAVARRWRTDHHEIVIHPDALLQELDEMVWHLDEPYGGGLPSWFVFKAIGADAKVAMTGTGGDELFGNYGKWRSSLDPRRRWWARGLAALRGQPLALLRGAPQGALFPMYLSEIEKRSIWGGPTGADRLVPTEVLVQEAWDAAGGRDPRDRVAAVDFRMQLPEEFLLMTDRFSMAHSVEARVPFLDHLFVDEVLRIPASQRSPRHDPKALLRRAVSDLLPPELLSSPKRGFVLPLDRWLRGPLRGRVEALLGAEHLRAQGIFRRELWAGRVKPYLEGRNDLTQQVWTLLMFQLWHERFLDRN